MVGELGWLHGREMAEYVLENGYKKPIVAYIAGRSAPEGKRMGHAGAIISRGHGTVKGKREALNRAGVRVASKPAEVRTLLKNL